MIDIPENTALNGICPYFTMFPLDFPLSVLKSRMAGGDRVLDPFCGRGTTNFASRLLELDSIGIDNSPVAVALSRAKIAVTTPEEIIKEAHAILEEVQEPQDIPQGDFWQWAYDQNVLKTLCRFRDGLLQDAHSDARQALQAIILGALHGPRGKTRQSYFSNQSQRTYAPKPNYAVKYWSARDLHPPCVDTMEIIKVRAQRYYGTELPKASGKIIHGDSREPETFREVEGLFDWFITSPPYYGMRTYLPDQWLRLWFLGGPSFVDYSNTGQLDHSSQDDFIFQLRQVWKNIATISATGAQMVVRFGSINDRKVDTEALIRSSLDETPWAIHTIEPAGRASDGKRQALHFGKSKEARPEYDIWAKFGG